MPDENENTEAPNSEEENSSASSEQTTTTAVPETAPKDKLAEKVYGEDGKEAEDKEAEAENNEASEEENKPDEQEAAEQEAIDIELPEGMEPDDPRVAAFMELANEHLSGEEVDIPAFLTETFELYAEQQKEAEAASEQDFIALNEQWREQLEKDFGGKAQADVALAEVAKQKIAYVKAMNAKHKNSETDWEAELDQALTMTGAGNHPAIVRFVSFLTSQLGEGRPLAGAEPPDTKPQGMAKLYAPENMRGGGKLGPRPAAN